MFSFIIQLFFLNIGKRVTLESRLFIQVCRPVSESNDVNVSSATRSQRLVVLFMLQGYSTDPIQWIRLIDKLADSTDQSNLVLVEYPCYLLGLPNGNLQF